MSSQNDLQYEKRKMSTRIPWERQAGEDVEHVVAIYICRLFPNAVHIRPSQGDHGIDVLVNNEDQSISVYQVKRFAQNLSAKQKQSIVKSWETLQNYIAEEEIEVREWHLVMPLDPTNENLTWMKGFTSKSSAKIHWDGLSKIEGWTAQMPEVSDYYFENGNKRFEEFCTLLMKAAQLPDFTSIDQFKKQLGALQGVLEDKNPNYSYSIHLYSKYEYGELKLIVRPGIVMTTIEELPDGTTLVIDIIEKHKGAGALAPMTAQVTFAPADESEKKKIEDFLAFGTPFESIEASIEGPSGIFLLHDDRDSKGAIVSVGGLSHNSETLNFSLVTRNGQRLHLEQETCTFGFSGFRWRGSDASGIVAISLTIDTVDTHNYTINCNQAAPTERPIGVVRRAFEFLNLARTDEEVSLFMGKQMIGYLNFSKAPFPLEYVEKGLALTQVLNQLNQRSDKEIHYPNIEKMTVGDFKRYQATAEFINRGFTLLQVGAIEIETSSQFPSDKPVHLVFTKDIEESIGAQDYHLGIVLTSYIAEAIEAKENEEGIRSGVITFLAGETYGTTAIRTLIEDTADGEYSADQMMVLPAPTVDEWESLIATYIDRKDLGDTDVSTGNQ